MRTFLLAVTSCFLHGLPVAAAPQASAFRSQDSGVCLYELEACPAESSAPWPAGTAILGTPPLLLCGVFFGEVPGPKLIYSDYPGDLPLATPDALAPPWPYP